VTRCNGDDHRVGTLMLTLNKLGDEDVMRVLTFVMAETLQSGPCVIEQIGTQLNVDMAELWEPDDAFFDLIRDKAAINAMLKHIGGKSVADGNVSATSKVQKKIIRDFLTGEGREKKDNWLPHYMALPFKSYTKSGAGNLTENARRAKQILG
jgi:ParB family chromosome partitioning protein